MHHDPLISSRAKPLVSWGHDWVVLCLIVVHPFWAPTKVFALPIAVRLYRNRQGLTKGKKKNAKPAKAKRDHRTRPQLAVELLHLAAAWFPNDSIIASGDSAYGGKSVLSHLPSNVHLISHVHPKGALYAPPPPPTKGRKGPPRKKGERLPRHGRMGGRSQKTVDRTAAFDQFRPARQTRRQDATGPLLQKRAARVC